MSFSEWEDSTGIDRRKLLVIVISAAVAGAAIVLMALMLFNKNATPAQAAPPASPAGAGNAEQGGQPMETLAAPPAGVSWSAEPVEWMVGAPQIALPHNTEFGPSTGTASGFQRSPSGAVVAAAQLGFAADPSHVADGPHKASAVAKLQPGSKPVADGVHLSIQGFKFVGQPTTDKALVDLLIGMGPSFFPASCTLDLRWIDGDWRVYAHSADDVCLASQQAVSDTDRASYIAWGPA